MPVVLVPVLLVLVIAMVVAVAVGVRSRGTGTLETHEELAGPAQTLEYVVPPGQDPALLVSVLQEEGYQAAPDPGQTNLLHIDCPSGLNRERPRVRATLESVGTAIDSGAPVAPEPVRFADEG